VGNIQVHLFGVSRESRGWDLQQSKSHERGDHGRDSSSQVVVVEVPILFTILKIR
jgi:hypothetical protein